MVRCRSVTKPIAFLPTDPDPNATQYVVKRLVGEEHYVAGLSGLPFEEEETAEDDESMMHMDVHNHEASDSRV